MRGEDLDVQIIMYKISYMDTSGECNLLGSVSSQQKFEVTDVKALGVSQLSDTLQYSFWLSGLGQISVTAPCYSSVLFRK